MRNAALVLILLLASTAVGTAANGSIFHRNLIVNGDAEGGPGGSSNLVPIPGWTRVGNFNVWRYGDSGVPSLTDPGPSNRGKNFFAGGPSNAKSSAWQVVDVSSAASNIDSGKVRYELSGYIGGYGGQDDAATVTVQFEDATGKALASAAIGPVTPAERQSKTGTLFRKHDGVLPAGTRQVRVTITAVRTDGSDNDGQCDNLSLVLSP